MLWYLPTFYGDIRLERAGEKGTVLTWEKLTEAEKQAVTALGEAAVGGSWLGGKHQADLFAKDAGRVELVAPLAKVQKILAKALKPDRKLVDVVVFAGGKVEETAIATLHPEKAKKARAGATVAKPVLGCPEPSLAKAEILATEVLFAFLNEGQQDDFRHHNAFVSQGAGTGHRYMVTSRHATDRLSHYRRQLYDLDEKRPYCVHDYDVPAPEEMLALHLLLGIPRHERYLRHLKG